MSLGNMNQTGGSSFIAERNARVNARSRASWSAGLSASADSTSMLDHSTVSVHSSDWSTMANPRRSPQPLWYPPTTAMYHAGLYASQSAVIDHGAINFFDADWTMAALARHSPQPLLPPADIFTPNFSSIFENPRSPLAGSESTADSLSPDSNTRSPNASFTPILAPFAGSFSFSDVPAPIARPRGGTATRRSLPQHARNASDRPGTSSRSVSFARADATVTLPPYALSLVQSQENTSSVRRTRANSLVSRNSSSDSSDGSRGSGSSRDAKDCSYCLSVNKYAIGHNKYNCPVLRDLPPCRICHASGKYNHTESHCPFQAKTDLEFIPKERRRTMTY